MSEYKTVNTKTGRVMYYKDGKLISKYQYDNRDAESETLEDENPTPKTVDTPKPEKRESRKCIFCGREGRPVFLNQTNMFVCPEDNDSHTRGEVVEQHRKATNAKQKTKV